MENRDFYNLGSRLRVARKAKGMSTRKVQEKLKEMDLPVSHVTIGNYEREVTRPTEEILKALSRIYKRSIEWLCGEGMTLHSVRYRALKSIGAGDRERFKYDSQAWLNAYKYTEQALNRGLNNKRLSFEVKRDWTGQQLAKELRRELNFDQNPIPSTIQILGDFGVYTLQLPAKEGIDAIAGWLNSNRIVVLNQNMSNDRIRLNALHELAHLLYEDCSNGPTIPHDDVEKRAFEFASHMLIPESMLKDALRLKSMVRLVQYKERFGISLAAMIYRAKEGHMITQSQYRKIWQEFGKLGYRKNEPGIVTADRPVRMEELIDAAVSNGKLSYDDIGRVSGIDPEEIKQRVLMARGVSFPGEDSGIRSTKTLDFVEYQKHHRFN